MSATILPFYLTAGVGLVNRVARTMASMDAVAADAYLLRLLEREQDRMRRQQIDQDRVDEALIRFARAVRAAIWQKENLHPGGGDAA